ncbi:MAG: GNAT family N-acetyltransferase [Chitinophagaceae bacterium]|nr:GNAT family N-acetyltransferase [Chitinophagaceae bacterium]
MIILECEHIKLIALTGPLLELLAKDPVNFEKELQLNPNKLELDELFTNGLQHALTTQCIPNVSRFPNEYKWFTNWIMVYKKENKYVGGIGTNGLPNEIGEIMVGYFVDAKYRRLGIATDAVRLLTNHLFEDQRLKTIVATIPIGHVASERTVSRNGFHVDGELEEDGMHLNRWILAR